MYLAQLDSTFTVVKTMTTTITIAIIMTVTVSIAISNFMAVVLENISVVTSLAIQAARFFRLSSSSLRRARSRPSTSKFDLLTSFANRFACAIFHFLSLQPPLSTHTLVVGHTAHYGTSCLVCFVHHVLNVESKPKRTFPACVLCHAEALQA